MAANRPNIPPRTAPLLLKPGQNPGRWPGLGRNTEARSICTTNSRWARYPSRTLWHSSRTWRAPRAVGASGNRTTPCSSSVTPFTSIKWRFSPIVTVKIEPGAAPGILRPQLFWHKPHPTPGQPLPCRAVGGLGIHIDEQIPFFHRNQGIPSFPGRILTFFQINHNAGNQKLPATDLYSSHGRSPRLPSSSTSAINRLGLF